MTPRDRLQRIVDLGRKTTRYWWLVAVFAVVGAALTLAFVLMRPKKYQSYSVLFYQERIQSSLLSNRQEEVQRNVGDRYRELLLAHAQLEAVIKDPATNPFPGEDDTDLAIDKLRTQIRFEARGANAFRIEYTDSDPDRAKAVTEKLTKLLQDKDEFLRNDQAKATVSFAVQQKDEAQTELNAKEIELAEFLAKHPEFAQDTQQASASGQVTGEGAGIRAIKNGKDAAKTGNPRIYALERQKRRIQARLDAPPDAPPIRIPAPETPEKAAAEAEVAQAKAELTEANRDLQAALTQYTEQHPTAIRAKERVAAAKEKLRKAQNAVPPDVETTVAPATEADRDKLRKELAGLDEQIAAEEKSDGKSEGSAASSTDWVVQLEAEHAKLRRQVSESRERFNTLADSMFRAQMDANQKLAESGGRLSVVDPAFRPVKPTGPGKTLLMMAGMALFFALGGGLALGMAVIDDRLYRRNDLESLGINVLAVIPPQMSIAEIKKRRVQQLKNMKKGRA